MAAMQGCTHDAGPGGTRRRILVVSSRYIGDTVLAIPFLRNLRRAFPDAVIDVLAERAAREVLADCPYHDALIPWERPPRGRRGWAELRATAAALRSRGYARAYLLKRSSSLALLARLAGIPHRVGFASEGSRLLLTKSVPAARGRHQVWNYLQQLRCDGIAVDDGHNENWVAAPVASRVAGVLADLPAGRPRVFLAVRGTDALRFWRPDRWARLVEWLVSDRGCEIVLCGGPADLADHEQLRAAVGPRVAAHIHDFSRDLTLRETGGLVARMDLCVGVDTGLVHLAASFGVPIVVLVGPTDANRWAPWMAPSEVVRPRRLARGPLDRLFSRLWPRRDHGLRWAPGRASMDDIGVAEVQDRVEALLPVGPAAAPALRTIDLRTGRFTYEVVSRPAAAVPATKPLAQAH